MAGGVFAPATCAPASRSLGTRGAIAAAAPLAPTGLVGSVSGATVMLSWTPPGSGDAPSSYVVEAGSSSGLLNLANFDTASTAASLTADNVPPGTYFVRVRARNGGGTSAASNEVVLTVGGGASTCSGSPSAPTNFTASVNDLSVTLTWTAPAGACAATSYVLEAGSASGRSDLANFNTGTAATSFRADGVGPGTFFVRVRAVNANGASAVSNEVRLTTSAACAAPSAPSNASASVNGSTMTLAWAAAGGSPAAYIVELGTSAGASNIASSNTGSTATSLSATLAPGTYFGRVRATNACATSAASNEVSFTVLAACSAPLAPTALTATVSGTTLSLAWGGVAGASSYVVEIGTASGASNIAAADTGSTATSLSTTLAAGTYFIRVAARSGCGQSAASSEITATVTPTTPVVSTVVTITSSGVSPKTLTVSPGTQVTFINNDRTVHEMTSDPHPEHDQCPEINQVGFLVEGQRKQTGNLNTVRSCGFHDHLNEGNPALHGTIIIR